jgi:hypothetical protein
MAKQYTGIDGALYVDDAKVARVSSWSFDASADVLETTSLGDFARNYVYGVQSFSGSATLFYYENDLNLIEGSALMSDVIRTSQTPTEPTHVMELRFDNGSQARKISFKCALNEVSISATSGEIIEANVSFTVCGPLSTVTVV